MKGRGLQIRRRNVGRNVADHFLNTLVNSDRYIDLPTPSPPVRSPPLVLSLFVSVSLRRFYPQQWLKWVAVSLVMLRAFWEALRACRKRDGSVSTDKPLIRERGSGHAALKKEQGGPHPMLPDVLSLAQAPADTTAGGWCFFHLVLPPAQRQGERRGGEKEKKKKRGVGVGGSVTTECALLTTFAFRSPPPPPPTHTHSLIRIHALPRRGKKVKKWS